MDTTDHPGQDLWLSLHRDRLWAVLGEDSFSWPLRASAWHQLAPLVERAGALLVYGPLERDALERHAPEALYRLWRPLVQEVAPAALLVWPCLPHYRWPAVLDATGIPHRHEAEALRALARAATGAFQELPDDLPALLGALLGQRFRPAWFPWPAASLTPAACHNLFSRLLADKPLPGRTPLEPEAADDMAAVVQKLFGPDGRLADAHPRFEYRESQRDLAVAAARAFQQEEVLLAEAGTGTGKSLAYLVPAALWAVAGHRPVVVATYTRNLQDQLWARELPVVRGALDRDINATVVKGRSNYACVRLVLRLVDEATRTLMPAERWVAVFLVSWLLQADQADLEALSPEAAEILPGLAQALDDTRAHYWRCLRGAPGGCQDGQVCALRRLRASAARSDLIITNQAMLLADAERDVLSDYTDAVIDEAHHLEEAATNALTLEVSAYRLWEAGRLLGGGGEGRDVPTSLIAAARRLNDSSGRWAAEAGRWSDRAAVWLGYSGALGDAVLDLIGVDPISPAEFAERRVTEEVWQTDKWRAVQHSARILQQAAVESSLQVQGLTAELQQQAQSAGALDPIANTLGDLMSVSLSLDELGQTLAQLLLEQMGRVVWAESYPAPAGTGRFVAERRWALYSAPVDVADPLNELLFDRCRGVVLTGATLSVDERFDFYRLQCGLDRQSHRLVEMVLPSPFDWERQLLVCLPNDLPDPGGPQHADAVIQTIARLAQISDGGVLALFTARQRMLAAYEALRRPLADLGLSLLCQDVSGERWWLLEQMRANDRTVLLGVRSLWEGVDVPGHHLRCVVVEKLPFAVPDDPLVAARMEYLARLGIEAYHGYYIPEAIRALRQGAGRLIRTADDRGVVFLLDPRVHRRGYGQRFIRALPPGRRVSARLERCLEAAAQWFSGGEGLAP